MKRTVTRIAGAAAALVAATRSASAQTQFRGFNNMVNDANRTVTDAGVVVINFASILIGVIAVVMLVWNFIKRSKNDASSNDALVGWGFGLLFAALGLQVVRFIFFGA